MHHGAPSEEPEMSLQLFFHPFSSYSQKALIEFLFTEHQRKS